MLDFCGLGKPLVVNGSSVYWNKTDCGLNESSWTAEQRDIVLNTEVIFLIYMNCSADSMCTIVANQNLSQSL